MAGTRLRGGVDGLPAAGMQKRHEQTAQRRLAAAVMAQKRHKLAVTDRAGDIVQYRQTLR